MLMCTIKKQPLRSPLVMIKEDPHFEEFASKGYVDNVNTKNTAVREWNHKANQLIEISLQLCMNLETSFPKTANEAECRSPDSSGCEVTSVIR